MWGALSRLHDCSVLAHIHKLAIELDTMLPLKLSRKALSEIERAAPTIIIFESTHKTLENWNLNNLFMRLGRNATTFDF